MSKKDTALANVGSAQIEPLAVVDRQTLSAGIGAAALAFKRHGAGDNSPLMLAVDGGPIPKPVLESDPQQIELPDDTATVIYVQSARLAEGTRFEDKGERDGMDVIVTGMALAKPLAPFVGADGERVVQFDPRARLVYCRAFLPFGAAVSALGSIDGIGTTRARKILDSDDLSTLSIFSDDWPADEGGRIDGLSARLSDYLSGLLLQLGNNGLRKSKRDATRQVRDYTFNAQRADDARLCIPDENGELRFAPLTAFLEHRDLAGGALAAYAAENGMLMQWWDRVEPVGD